MVEAAANSQEDYLIDGLSFKLKPGASYINERKSVTFHPQGSNIYSATGTKLIKLLLTGDNWLDPSTFRVFFDLVNTDPVFDHELRVLSGPYSFFKRMRVLCNGQIVEDIDDFNRVSEMFSILTSDGSRRNVAVEGFGENFDHYDWMGGTVSSRTFRGIFGGDYKSVCFKPLSGLLSQPKFIPLRYAPITIELELVSDSTLPIITKFGVVTSPLPEGANELTTYPFLAANTSVSWQIQNVQAKCDVVTLDNSLDNSYAEHLLSGKALPINYNTYISQIQSLLSGTNGQQKVRLNCTRALSRLKSAFITFDRSVTSEILLIGRKSFNDFTSPMANRSSHNSLGEFEFQVQLGAKLYPEYPIRSHSEAFYQLRKTLGVQASSLHSFDITNREYHDNKFVLAIDFERVLEAGFSGMNTRAGDILNVRFDHNNPDATTYAHAMHIILHSDCIMEIRDGGVTVLD